MKKIKCGCGQENELVESSEGLRYNVKRHGNGELCNDKCFNCGASLGLKPKPEPVKEPPKKTQTVIEPPEKDETETQTDEGGGEQPEPDELDGMNMAELRQRAAELGVSIPFTTVTKEGVRKLIREHLEKAEPGTATDGEGQQMLSSASL